VRGQTGTLTAPERARHECPMWVVYRRPMDYPGKELVARLWLIGWGLATPTDTVEFYNLIEEVHKEMVVNKRLVRLDRMSGDDPCVVETWI
jgi:hypothetical protein